MAVGVDIDLCRKVPIDEKALRTEKQLGSWELEAIPRIRAQATATATTVIVSILA